MQNASSLSDEQIKQMLKERGLSSDASKDGVSDLSNEEIKKMMQERGLPVKQPSFLGRVEQGAKDIAGGLARGVVDIPQGILESSPIPKVLQRIAQASGHPKIAAAAQPFSALGEQLPGNPDDLLYEAGRYGPAIAGGVRGAVDLGVGGARLAGRLGQKGAQALSNRSEIAARYFGKTVPQAEKNAANYARKALSQDYYGDENFHETLLGDEEQILRQELTNNYNLHRGIRSDYFNRALKKGGDNFAMNPKNVKRYKFLDKIEDTLGTKNIDSALKDRIDAFKESPTNENLHWLKSSVGKKMADLRKVPSQEMDKDAIENLSNIYKGMNNTLIKNLGEDYKLGVAYHKEHVLPYQLDRVINKAVRSDDPVGNLSNRIAKTGDATEGLETKNIDRIYRHLSDAQKNKVLLPQLKSAANFLGEADPNKLLDNLLKLKTKGFREFTGTDEHMHIQALKDLLEKVESEKAASQKVRKIINRSLGTGVALAGAGGGFHMARE